MKLLPLSLLVEKNEGPDLHPNGSHGGVDFMEDNVYGCLCIS